MTLSRLRVWWASRGRDLYRYYDGGRWRRCNPVAAAVKLEEVLPNYLEHLGAVTVDATKVPLGDMRAQAVKARNDGFLELARAARTVFDLPPLTDTRGLTDFEAVGVLARFFAFMEGLAAAARPFAI